MPGEAHWVIYIHGGAWRDPLVLSDSFSATVSHLVAHPSNIMIKGIASINYSLSPHPGHPNPPSLPHGLENKDAIDNSRVSTHPDHIFDVLGALVFLQDKYNFANNYILIGHACGATLALQVAMDHQRWGEDSSDLIVAKPKVIIGVNGLYDIPKLIHDPGEEHDNMVNIYTAIAKSALGEDKKVWHDISPSSVDNWAQEWKEGEEVILAQSREDVFVPYRQTEHMLFRLNSSRGPTLVVREPLVTGHHSFLWQDGRKLAEIVIKAVERLEALRLVDNPFSSFS
jgi:hypothetical protein